MTDLLDRLSALSTLVIAAAAAVHLAFFVLLWVWFRRDTKVIASSLRKGNVVEHEDGLHLEAFVKMMPARGLSRRARGCNGENDANWALMSGAAWIRNQLPSLSDNAADACVRGAAAMVRLRKPSQFGHPQFHCGNPPPAADPKT